MSEPPAPYRPYQPTHLPEGTIRCPHCERVIVLQVWRPTEVPPTVSDPDRPPPTR